MFEKLNLKTDDRVKLVKLGPDRVDSRTRLNGALGTVVGVSSRHIVDTYIVLLDEPYVLDDFTHRAVAITAEEIEAFVKHPNFSHARQGDGCWRDLVWIYLRDPKSPSGVTLACGGPSSIVDPVIREHRKTSALSPRER